VRAEPRSPYLQPKPHFPRDAKGELAPRGLAMKLGERGSGGGERRGGLGTFVCASTLPESSLRASLPDELKRSLHLGGTEGNSGGQGGGGGGGGGGGTETAEAGEAGEVGEVGEVGAPAGCADEPLLCLQPGLNLSVSLMPNKFSFGEVID